MSQQDLPFLAATDGWAPDSWSRALEPSSLALPHRAFAVCKEAPAPARSVDATAVEPLLLAVASGDRGRLQQLFEFLAPRAKAYLLHRGMTAAAAEQLAVQAVVEVWRTAHQYDATVCTGRTWLFQILRAIAYPASAGSKGLSS